LGEVPGHGNPDAVARHEMRAMLFADAVGYSKLSEDQIPGFIAGFLGAVGELSRRTKHPFEHVETSGDGLYMVFRHAADGAHSAREGLGYARPAPREGHGGRLGLLRPLPGGNLGRRMVPVISADLRSACGRSKNAAKAIGRQTRSLRSRRVFCFRRRNTWISRSRHAPPALARITREVADGFSARTPDKARFVAGVLGPMNRTLSLSPDVNDPGFRAVTFDQVRDSYKEATRALIEGGVDLILVETIFDTLNAK